MKHIFILLLTLTSLSSMANDLTSRQENEAVMRIDNICGDTWCGGDFDFSFETLNCDFKTQKCEFDFELIYYVWEGDSDEPTSELRTSYQCTLHEIPSYEYMVDGKWNLSWVFYEKVTDCVSEGEDHAYEVLDI